MNFNVLDQPSPDNQANVKLTYLENFESQLDIQCNELSLNNQILRSVIFTLTQQKEHQHSDLNQRTINQLVVRNKELEDKFIEYQMQLENKET